MSAASTLAKIMVWLFWLALIFLAYVFVGYPLLLGILSVFRSRPHERATIWPSASIIIAAHNEAGALPCKIKNTLELNYPEEKRQIIIVSDGSDDETPEVVRPFVGRGIQFLETPERRGKHYAQLLGRDASRGEILVFTDVSTQLEPDSLQKMVSNFADPAVGCVSSEDQVVVAKKGWLGERSYISFEMWLRRLESRIGSLVTASGSFFGARRTVCAQWHINKSSDFFVPINAAALGMRTVVDAECRGHYDLVRSEKAEFHRKVRTIVLGLDVLSTYLGALNPIRYGFFSWQLISHKLFRWLAPLAVLVVFVTNFFLWRAGIFYQFCLILQLILYGTAILALLLEPLARFKPLKMLGFFVMGNTAAVMAWVYFFSGERFVTWQPSRRN